MDRDVKTAGTGVFHDADLLAREWRQLTAKEHQGTPSPESIIIAVVGSGMLGQAAFRSQAHGVPVVSGAFQRGSLYAGTRPAAKAELGISARFSTRFERRVTWCCQSTLVGSLTTVNQKPSMDLTMVWKAFRSTGLVT